MRASVVAFAASLALAAAPLRAEERIDTPSGPAVISGEAYALTLRVGGTSFPLPESQFAFFGDRVGNLVLVSMSPGGNACPSYYAWLNTTPGAVSLSASFGTCSDLYKVSWDSETVTVTMPSMVPGEGDVAFVYDGKAVREVALGLPQSGHPPGSDPAGWIGAHPYDLVNSADWAPVLTALIGAEALAALRETMQLSDGFKSQDGWVVGTGFNKYTDDQAGVALTADGRILVAMRPAGGQPRLWGDASRGMPSAIAELMAGR